MTIQPVEYRSEAEMRASVKALRAKFDSHREPGAPPRLQRPVLKTKPIPEAEPEPAALNALFLMLVCQHVVKANEKPPEIEGPLRIEHIQQAVAKHYNVSVSDMKSHRRTQDVVRPRQVAVYLARMLTPRSLPEIGRLFGGRDHTTQLSSIRKITRLLQTDAVLRADVRTLTSSLTGGRQ